MDMRTERGCWYALWLVCGFYASQHGGGCGGKMAERMYMMCSGKGVGELGLHWFWAEI